MNSAILNTSSLSGLPRVERGRVQLVRGGAGLPAAAFWGSLAMRLALVLAPQFDTMATDGESIFVNADFADSLTEEELIGVLAHEAAHCALNHMGRRGSRDPGLWNEACDYEINPLLIAHGFTLPRGCLLDSRFDGLACEQIYTILANERAQQNKPQQQPQQGQQQGQQGQQG